MVTMYSTTWCGSCRRLRSQLDREGIAYTVVDIEDDPHAADYVMSVNGGNQTVPTLRFVDGSALPNPSIVDVTRQLAAIAGEPATGSGAASTSDAVPGVGGVSTRPGHRYAAPSATITLFFRQARPRRPNGADPAGSAPFVGHPCGLSRGRTPDGARTAARRPPRSARAPPRSGRPSRHR